MPTANSGMTWVMHQVGWGGREAVNTYINILKTISWVTVTLSLSSYPTMVEKSCLKSCPTDRHSLHQAQGWFNLQFTSWEHNIFPSFSHYLNLHEFPLDVHHLTICQVPFHLTILFDPPNLIPIWQKGAWASEEWCDLPKVTQLRRDLNQMLISQIFIYSSLQFFHTNKKDY